MSAAALLCLVIAISDGDTLTVRCGTPGAWRPQRVRVVAIDAPESRQAFALLGLEPPSTPDQIRQAYRRQARSLHPDFGGASEPFILLQRAYRLALESCI